PAARARRTGPPTTISLPGYLKRVPRRDVPSPPQPLESTEPSGQAQTHRQRLAAADADARYATLRAARFHGGEQRHEDASAGGAYRVAEGDRSAEDVDVVGGETQLLHQRHGHDRERLVHLVGADVARGPA